MQKKHALIFDMDGVIADTAALHEKAWFAFCKNHNVHITAQLFRNTLFGMSNRETLKILYSHEIPENEFWKFVDEKEKLFRQLAANELVPMTGLIDFLTEASNNGFRMAVASSAPMENIVFILEKTGTGEFFDFITSADEITHSKPHPDIFLKTASKLNFKPAECVVFEDSFAGIQAGNSAGMKVVGVASTHNLHELTNTILKITNFDEINIRILSQLFDLK